MQLHKVTNLKKPLNNTIFFLFETTITQQTNKKTFILFLFLLLYFLKLTS